jgi:hypothetical protein
VTGVHRTVTKRTKDAALEHIKKALRTKESLLTKPEMAFVRTSCHILGVNSETTMKVIVSRAKEKGENQPRRVLLALHAQLEELGARVERHKRHTPTPTFNTRTMDSMGAPARSLGHLQDCVKGRHKQNVSLQNVSSTKRLLTKRLHNKTSPRQNVSLTKRLL